MLLRQLLQLAAEGLPSSIAPTRHSMAHITEPASRSLLSPARFPARKTAACGAAW
jgi:hypothetical protein